MGMSEDAKSYVEYCDSCLRVEPSIKLLEGLLHTLQPPTRKWQSMSMEIYYGIAQK